MKKFPFVAAIFILLLSGCSHNEGTVKYDDCREIIRLDKDSWRLNLYSFTCDYYKEQGKILSGTCVRVELDDGFFSHSGRCKTTYVYTFWNGVK